MNERFQNRTEAGEFLAEKLEKYARRDDVRVLALPRGGVPVAAVIAEHLQVPLDVFMVRKLGVLGHEELAMGAIATGGVRILNREVTEGLQISPVEIEAAIAEERRELMRREHAYRGHRPAPEVAGWTVILVDDGIATGSTVRAAIAALRQQRARHIIVATPVVAHRTYLAMLDEVDEFVAVTIPLHFASVGEWYQDFSPTTDEEVCSLLDQARRHKGEANNENHASQIN